MKKLLLFCLAFASYFTASAVTPPINSTTNGTDVWYFIKCIARDPAAPSAMWLTGVADDGTSVLTNSVLSSTNDALLWKVVNNADGIALVNKKYGTFLNADQTPFPTVTIDQAIIKCVTAAPSAGLKLVNYADQSVVPNGFYLVNASATGTIDNSAANATTSFQFYSAGSGSTFRPVNYGPTQPNVNSAIVFLTPKDILKSAIDVATIGLNNATQGISPGQYSAESIEGFGLSLEDAKVVLDNPASTTEDYFNTVDQVNGDFAMFKTYVNTPQISSDVSESWYYIQAPRPANTYLTSTAAGAALKDNALVPSDSQLWKLVSNGSGFAIKNKATGEYVQTDVASNTNLVSQATMPTKTLRFITSGETTAKTYRFWIENTIDFAADGFRLHAGTASVMNWTGNANDNSTWMFILSDDIFRIQFKNAIATARATYNTAAATAVGDEFGQFNTTTLATFDAALKTAEALNAATMSEQELIAAKQSILDATNAFTVNKRVSSLSSGAKIKWFRFVNNQTPAGYATAKAMTSNGRSLTQAYTYETVDENSDAQLFRFILNGSGTKATTIVNKASGLFVSAEGKVVDVATSGNEFELTALDATTFWIKPTTKAPLHAASANTDIVNWNSGAGSASAWKIQYVKSEDVTDLKPSYLKAIADARTYYNNTSGGNGYAQYPLAARSAFNTVIAAEEIKDAATMTNTQLSEGILSLENATVQYDNAFVREADATPYKWYTIESVKFPGKYITLNPTTNALTCANKDNSNNQLFRFEHKPNQDNYTDLYNVICNTSPTGSIRCEGNGWDIVYNTGTNFSAGGAYNYVTMGYFPWHMILTQGTNGTQILFESTSGDAFDTADGATFNNCGSGKYDGNAAWRVAFVKADEGSSVPTTSTDNVRIYAKNRMLVVSGTQATPKAYTVSGVQVDATKALQPGIYVVKVANVVRKIVVN